MIEGHRKCSGKCRRTLPLTVQYFYKRKGSRGDAGFASRCKVCLREQVRLARQRSAHSKPRPRLPAEHPTRLSREEISRMAVRLAPLPWEQRAAEPE